MITRCPTDWTPDPTWDAGDRFTRSDGAVCIRPSPLGGRGWQLRPAAADVPLRTKAGRARTWRSPQAAMAWLDGEHPSATAVLPGPIRAITVRQPWAGAIAQGPKRVENRTWRVAVPEQGRLLAIHAGSTYDRLTPEAWEDYRLWWPEAPKHRGLVQGQVVGVALLTGIEAAPVQSTRDGLPPWCVPSSPEKTNYWWRLDAVMPVDGPRLPGKLGLWQLPDGDARSLTEQWIDWRNR